MYPRQGYLKSSQSATSPLDLQADGCLEELFAKMAWKTDAWPDAQLQECMFYLRRSKLSQLPETFKDLIPASEFELNYMIQAQ